MNILFVGSGDITANYLADRLYREGHNISWATKEEKSLLLKRNLKERYTGKAIGRVFSMGFCACRELTRLYSHMKPMWERTKKRGNP